MSLPTPIERPKDIPFCEKCKRQVEHFEIEMPIISIPNIFTGYMEQRYTGEVIFTVRCHGEIWQQKYKG